MIKKAVKKAVQMIERSVYKVLSDKQIESIKGLLTNRQKRFIKKFLFAGKWQRQEVAEIKQRLYNLGFTKKGLDELERLSNNNNEPYLQRLAIWELALWHANQYNESGAQQCLQLISRSIEGEKSPIRLKQAAIMRAECYDILGEIDKAKKELAKLSKEEAHADVYLAAANLETSLEDRLSWINQVMKLNKLSEITIKSTSEELPVYDCLTSSPSSDENKDLASQPKVSVIMPVYNAEEVIHTSLSSILSQSWTNLEVLVADDCSTDDTVRILEEYEKKDKRVKLILVDKNGGAYVARNTALKEATGDFITINDADDWSHPEKIEIQVNHLLKNPTMVGNTSQQARATNDMKFYRRGKPGTYIFSNMSSFLFRREPVVESLGYWDSVRFAADSEFIRRIKKVFGEKSICELETGPLSFQRQTTGSLTGNSAFGYHGYKMGARKEYEESHDHFHENSSNLYYSFPQEVRPFAVPEPMWPSKEEKVSGYRQFDIIYVFDFRYDEDDTNEVLAEVKKCRLKGLRVGLVQMSEYDVDPKSKINRTVRDILNNGQAEMIVYGEKVETKRLIIRNSIILDEWQKYIPNIHANQISVVLSETSISKRDESRVSLNLELCNKHLNEYFGMNGIWYPENEQVRQKLLNEYSNEITSITLAEQDWDLEEISFEK
ncbi:glycosyltransferase family 2 protein [Evansella halocellulosilytica]|uniref:glycosyltransferase family 2 protein n=1 Tax=Evansella halocellulosilytica TaxID=2011013 RepID=UPI000BB6824A|nr:glycosyltransferase family A protein [Evansella halocellulosilytica]